MPRDKATIATLTQSRSMVTEPALHYAALRGDYP
jgi:hypothetical protein